jgi:hypothetical protein
MRRCVRLTHGKVDETTKVLWSERPTLALVPAWSQRKRYTSDKTRGAREKTNEK